MKTQYFDGSVFERGGKSFRVNMPYDDSGIVPWKDFDGHGPVDARRTKDKRAGERVLLSERDYYVFYDYAEAIKTAKRDEWGPTIEGQTAGQRAAAAVEQDFQFLRGFVNNDWSYIGVVVTLIGTDCEPTQESESLWGVESDPSEYLVVVAHELADEILSRLSSVWRAALTEARSRKYWESRDVVTSA